MLSWLSFEQYELEPNVATVRFWLSTLSTSKDAELGEKLAEKREKGYRALAVLNQGLKGGSFLVGSRFSIADISLYAYTHVASEGGFDSTPLPAHQRLAEARRRPAESRADHLQLALPDHAYCVCRPLVLSFLPKQHPQ